MLHTGIVLHRGQTTQSSRVSPGLDADLALIEFPRKFSSTNGDCARLRLQVTTFPRGGSIWVVVVLFIDTAK